MAEALAALCVVEARVLEDVKVFPGLLGESVGIFFKSGNLDPRLGFLKKRQHFFSSR